MRLTTSARGTGGCQGRSASVHTSATLAAANDAIGLQILVVDRLFDAHEAPPGDAIAF